MTDLIDDAPTFSVEDCWSGCLALFIVSSPAAATLTVFVDGVHSRLDRVGGMLVLQNTLFLGRRQVVFEDN